MTVHSDFNYRCKNCQTGYVPLSTYHKCPKCGTDTPNICDDFIGDAIHSAIYNYYSHRSFQPGIWGTFTVGDAYYGLTFDFLTFAASSLKIRQRDLLGAEIADDAAQKLVADFLAKILLGDEQYMADYYKAFCMMLLRSPKNNKTVMEETISRIAELWKRAANRGSVKY